MYEYSSYQEEVRPTSDTRSRHQAPSDDYPSRVHSTRRAGRHRKPRIFLLTRRKVCTNSTSGHDIKPVRRIFSVMHPRLPLTKVGDGKPREQGNPRFFLPSIAYPLSWSCLPFSGQGREQAALSRPTLDHVTISTTPPRSADEREKAQLVMHAVIPIPSIPDNCFTRVELNSTWRFPRGWINPRLAYNPLHSDESRYLKCLDEANLGVGMETITMSHSFKPLSSQG